MSATATFWDGIAEQYAAKPVDDPAAFDRKTDITKAHLHPDAVVLDVGCGTGSFALRLAPHVRHVHGLDLSGAMVAIARRKAEAVDNVTFHQGTLDDHGFEPGSLDMVCAYSLLHLVRDRPDALARIHALLKPGGVFVASTVCLGDSWVPYGLLLTVMRWLGRAPWVAVFREATLLQEVRDAGFVELQTPDVGASSDISFLVARAASPTPPGDGS